MSDSISSAAIMDTLRDQLSQINATVDHQEASVVTEVGDGIATVYGLNRAVYGRASQVHQLRHGPRRLRPGPEPRP